jgi:hypothetical protein
VRDTGRCKSDRGNPDSQYTARSMRLATSHEH